MTLFCEKADMHVCVLTWQGRSQAMRDPAGGDAPHNTVKQETDLLSFWTGQEENTGPCKTDGRETDSSDNEKRHMLCDG